MGQVVEERADSLTFEMRQATAKVPERMEDVLFLIFITIMSLHFYEIIIEISHPIYPSPYYGFAIENKCFKKKGSFNVPKLSACRNQLFISSCYL